MDQRRHAPPTALARSGRLIGLFFALILGAVLLSGTFQVPYGGPTFVLLTVGTGLCWIAVRLLVPRPRGDLRLAGPHAVVVGAGAGIALAVVFLLGAMAVQLLPIIGSDFSAIIGPVSDDNRVVVLTAAVLLGIAEELAFRGGLYELLPPRLALVGSTLLYALVTAATGSIVLTLAAVLLGGALGVLRARTGSVLACAVAHAVWGAVMILVLPALPVLTL